jgi:hypothetical protein
MSERTLPQDRMLIQALMLCGWYRVGHGAADASGRCLWRFRSGHCTDGPPGEVLTVRARTERGAMRALLEHLQGPLTSTDARSADDGGLVLPAGAA